MGRRTAAILDFIRFLRTTEPKYSFEVLIFNIVVGLAAVVCTLLDEQRLWLMLFGVLWISLGIHWFRIRQSLKRRMQWEQAWMERMLPRIEQALAEYDQAMDAAHKRKTADPAELAQLREDVERAQQREAAGEP